MIETSQELINSMRADAQTTSARINIVSYKAGGLYTESNNVNEQLQDVGICEDLGSSTTYEQYNMSQLTNLRMNETGNYAVFEGDGIALSGMQCISKTNTTNQFGYWSEWLSDDYGYFNPDTENAYPILVWQCQESKQSKLNIVFSKVKDEYAVNFDVIVDYLNHETEEEQETKTYNIIDNDKTIYTIEDLFNNTEWKLNITIKIYKWSKSNARAKVCQLCFGDILEYEDDKIVNIKVAKGVSLVNKDTESKEIELTIQDEDEEYNIFEPTGELVNLNINSSLCLELGCVIDDFIYYVKVDEFTLSKPKKEQNSLEVSITGSGLLNKYAETDFKANYYEQIEPQSILNAIFGESNTYYFSEDDEIANENNQIRTQYGTVKIPNALNKIATAIRGNILETIDNQVIIKRIEEGTPVATITLNECIENPEIEKEEIPSTINVNIYNSKDTGNETIYDETLYSDGTADVTFKYNKDHTCKPYTIKAINTDDNSDESEVLEQSTIFLENCAIGSSYTISASGQYYSLIGNYQVVITGDVIEISNTTQTYSTGSDSTDTVSIEDESIENTTQAKKVYEWLLSNYNKCFKYKIEVQDTFTYELGDTVLLETGVYVNGEQIIRKAIITNIEYEYDGALTYNLTLKGA